MMHDPSQARVPALGRTGDGMHNRVATTLALAMCTLAVVIPIGAALYVAHHQSMDGASRQALMLAGAVLHRADTMGGQALAAYERLHRIPLTDACSDAKREQLRAIVMDYSYILAVGYVSNDRIVCSAIGPRDDGIDMGPPDYVSRLGARIHTAVPLGGSRDYLVMEKGGFAATIHPEALLDVSTGIRDLSLGVFSRSTGMPWTHQGALEQAWLVALGPAPARHTVFFDGKHLVAVQASDKLDIAAYAAIPLADLKSRLRSSVILLLPIGLALGLAMAAAIVFLARQRASLPAVLRAALRRREFVLHYQPIVELASGHMVGAEAVLRWPGNRQIGQGPALFIQAAEECGLIQRFTQYVLAQVAIDGPRYFSRHPGAYISVNLSSADLRSGDIIGWLRRLVGTPGIAPYNIVVEVTEHSFVDPASASRTIGEIRALGIRVAIDDFGTGFSSLSHLTNLSADYLKIDKVFIDAIGTDSVTSEVVLHIISMARSLNLTLISEGVETRTQADFLRQHGVAFAQGWLFSKALSLAELSRRRDVD
jgi:sensor c-di-GMP phosphodiesterase-like protein